MAALIAVIVALALPSAPSQALFAPRGASIPPYAMKIGDYHMKQSSWTIWLFGRREKGCWGTRSRLRGELTGESVACGLDVPERQVQLAACGSVSVRPAETSVVVFLVRTPEVRRLKVRLEGMKGGSGLITTDVTMFRNDARERAQLPNHLGYSTRFVNGGPVCPRYVTPLDRYGRQVGRGVGLPPCPEA